MVRHDAAWPALERTSHSADSVRVPHGALRAAVTCRFAAPEAPEPKVEPCTVEEAIPLRAPR